MKRSLAVAMILMGVCQPLLAFDFAANTPMDQTVESLKSKYQGNMAPTSCIQETAEGCQKKFKEQCQCYKVSLVSYQDRNHNLFLTAHGGKIVEFNSLKNISPRQYQEFLKPVEESTGTEKPRTIYEGRGGQGIQPYILVWKQGDTTFSSTAWCPLEKSGGAFKVNRKLRQCYEKGFGGTKVIDLSIKAKTVQVDY